MIKKVLLAAILLSLLPPMTISAQNQQSGISVTPSIAHLDLAIDPPEYLLTYTNNFATDISLSLSARDFTQLTDNYQLDFLNQNQAENYQYSLSPWITFETTSLELAPKETRTIKIFINKDRITKGGHYASILAEITSPPDTKNISVKAVISSLLFVRADTGKELEEGKISSLEPLRGGIEFPDSFVLRFQNNGNVHVIPYGLLQVFDPLGNLVAKGILNENSLDALPESIRTYTIPVTTFGQIIFPGNYTAKLNIHFGKTNQKVSQQIKFFSQGSFDFVKIGVGLIFFIIALSIYRKLRRSKIKP